MSHKKYGIIGENLNYCKSFFLQNSFSRDFFKKNIYTKIDSDENSFIDHVEDFFDRTGEALIVKSPFLEIAYSIADELTESAIEAKSVNLLKLGVNGKIIGHNTIGNAMLADMKRLGIYRKNKSFVIIGNNCTSRSIVSALKKTDFLKIEVLENNQLVQIFRTELTNEQLDNPACTIINTVKNKIFFNNSLSKINTCKNAFFYEAIYQKGRTDFLNNAEILGFDDTTDGAGLLVANEIEIFKILNQESPNLKNQESPNLKKSLIMFREFY